MKKNMKVLLESWRGYVNEDEDELEAAEADEEVGAEDALGDAEADLEAGAEAAHKTKELEFSRVSEDLEV